MAGKTTTTQESKNNQDYSGQQNGVFGRSDTPTTTPEWMTGNTSLWGALGQNGLNAGQQDALGGWQNYLRDPNNGVSQIAEFNKRLAPFTTPQANTAGASGPVVAGTGASYAPAYRNPFEDQVVGSTIADLTHAFDQTQNKLRGQYGGQGWSPTAGAPSGEQVAAGESAGDFIRTLGSTVGGLRSQGFNTANAFGAQDAGNALSASGQNADLGQRLNMFNAGQGDTADARAMGAIQQQVGNAGAGQQLGGQAVQQAFDMSGGGIQQLLAALGIQIPAFGNSSSGFNFGNTSGTSSGTSSGTGTQTKSPGLVDILGALGQLASGASGFAKG